MRRNNGSYEGSAGRGRTNRRGKTCIFPCSVGYGGIQSEDPCENNGNTEELLENISENEHFLWLIRQR